MLVSAHDGGVDHHVFVVVIPRQQLENTLENSALRPSIKTLIDDFPVTKALGQITPRNASSVSVENRFDEHGESEKHWRERETERPGSLHIDDKIKPRGLDDRQLSRLLTVEDATSIDTGLAISIGEVCAVTHQPAHCRKSRKRVDARYLVACGQGRDLVASSTPPFRWDMSFQRPAPFPCCRTADRFGVSLPTIALWKLEKKEFFLACQAGAETAAPRVERALGSRPTPVPL